MGMTTDDAKQLEELEKMQELISSGYAGINKNGNIVDRRLFPSAIPCQENRMLNTPKPKKLPTDF